MASNGSRETTTDRQQLFDANRTLVNFSDTDAGFPDDEVQFYVALHEITAPTIFAVIILVGLLGNLLVIGVTLSRRKMWTTVNLLLLNLDKSGLSLPPVTASYSLLDGSQLANRVHDNLTVFRQLWTTVNLLLLNLAVTDIIFVVICVPLVAYHYAAEVWLIGDVACKLYQFFLSVTVYVTVYTLVAIAVIRYHRLYNNWFTSQTAESNRYLTLWACLTVRRLFRCILCAALEVVLLLLPLTLHYVSKKFFPPLNSL